MGVCIIARDSECKVLAVMCSTSRMYITDLTMAEAYATWKAVLFGKDPSLRNAILEGDFMKIVQAFCKEDQLWQRYSNLIEVSKIILHSL